MYTALDTNTKMTFRVSHVSWILSYYYYHHIIIIYFSSLCWLCNWFLKLFNQHFKLRFELICCFITFCLFDGHRYLTVICTNWQKCNSSMKNYLSWFCVDKYLYCNGILWLKIIGCRSDFCCQRFSWTWSYWWFWMFEVTVEILWILLQWRYRSETLYLNFCNA